MTSYPAGYSSEEDEFDDFGCEIKKPTRNYLYEPVALTPNEKLIDAACSNDVDAAKEALEEGADIHHRSHYSMNQSPIMRAASFGCFEVMEFLINQGANVNDDLEMFNVIMCLCNAPLLDENILLKCLNLLLDNKADPLAVDWMGATSLMNAVRRGRPLLAAKLLESGCSVNAADGEGWTPLFYAVQMDNVEMTKFLLDSGGDIKMLTRHGVTLWDLADQKNDKVLSDLVTPKELLDPPEDHIGRVKRYTSQFKALMSGIPKLDDRMFGYHEDTVRFIRGIGLDNIASEIEKKKIQFSELMTWKKQDWIKAGIELSYPLKKIELCVRKYHEKEWGQGSIPNAAHVVSKQNEVVELFAVLQVLINCLRNAHITSASSLYILENYEGPLTSETKEGLANIMKSTLIIKKQVMMLRRFIGEIDHPTLCPPDVVVPRCQRKHKKILNSFIAICLPSIVRILVNEWRSC